MDAAGNRREKIIKGQKEKRVGYHGEHIAGQEGVKFILDGRTHPLICVLRYPLICVLIYPLICALIYPLYVL